MFDSKPPRGETPASEIVKPSLADTVSYVQLASALLVKVDTLHGWVRQGRIRQPIYFGTQARWTVEAAQQIVREGTSAAGTYPPADSPRAKQLLKRPKSVGKSLGHTVSTDGRPRPKKLTPRKPPTKSKGAK